MALEGGEVNAGNVVTITGRSLLDKSAPPQRIQCNRSSHAQLDGRMIRARHQQAQKCGINLSKKNLLMNTFHSYLV